MVRLARFERATFGSGDRRSSPAELQARTVGQNHFWIRRLPHQPTWCPSLNRFTGDSVSGAARDRIDFIWVVVPEGRVSWAILRDPCGGSRRIAAAIFGRGHRHRGRSACFSSCVIERGTNLLLIQGERPWLRRRAVG